jgi:hypothetical protein
VAGIAVEQSSAPPDNNRAGYSCLRPSLWPLHIPCWFFFQALGMMRPKELLRLQTLCTQSDFIAFQLCLAFGTPDAIRKGEDVVPFDHG